MRRLLLAEVARQPERSAKRSRLLRAVQAAAAAVGGRYAGCEAAIVDAAAEKALDKLLARGRLAAEDDGRRVRMLAVAAAAAE